MVEVSGIRLKLALVALTLAGLGAPLAKAEISLPSGPLTLLEHTQLVDGGFSSTFDFLVPAAGTISIVIADLVSPERFGSLHLRIKDATSMLGALNLPGSMSFQVTEPGRYFALICGDTQGELDLGLYSLKVQWTALAAAAPVPLPAAGWLLVTGMAGLFGLARRRREDAMA